MSDGIAKTHLEMASESPKRRMRSVDRDVVGDTEGINNFGVNVTVHISVAKAIIVKHTDSKRLRFTYGEKESLKAD